MSTPENESAPVLDKCPGPLHGNMCCVYFTIARLRSQLEAQRSLIEAGERLRVSCRSIRAFATRADIRCYEEACEAYDAAAARVKGTT